VGILSWIVLGLVAGALARWLMPGPTGGGLLVTIALGIAGALVGGFLAVQLDLGDVNGINLHSLLIAVAGAVLLLFLFRLMRR
jgi:uncharacterized membrane protein YeaQ/YmgE (transglycosylase-associated protein family)